MKRSTLIEWVCYTIIAILLGVLLACIQGCYFPYCQEHEHLTVNVVPDSNTLILDYDSYITYGSCNILTNRTSDNIKAQSARTSISVGANTTTHDPNLYEKLGSTTLSLMEKFIK